MKRPHLHLTRERIVDCQTALELALGALAVALLMRVAGVRQGHSF